MRLASKRRLRKSRGAAGKKAHTEIEVKLRIPDKRRLLRQLARLEAKLISARVHEMNTLYDTPDGNLARHGQMLRLRVERPASRAAGAGRKRKASAGKTGNPVLLTFKGPAKGRKASKPGQYKIREENELRIPDRGEALMILEAFGVRPWFRYEKFRTVFGLRGMRGLKLALDETPIGVFLELEGPREEINRAAELLGFARSGYINKSYGALFMEERGLAGRASHNEPVPFSGVPDMVFGRSRRQERRDRTRCPTSSSEAD
jgi:adenylate cyclase class 2